VWDLGLGVHGIGLKVCSGFRVQASGFPVRCLRDSLGCKGLGFML
jgi:hypothetical protein